MKTNAARALDRLDISDELREYEVDASDLAAETVAAKIGLPARQVLKVRGTQVLLAPADYVRATGARVAAIARPKS
jgi:prolyl-tRNA editing enzyme YbaK/EbsC (Cys-tRNA(Pro) deacylase)